MGEQEKFFTFNKQVKDYAMRKEWVWCRECGADLEIGLVELVRTPKPLCLPCREDAVKTHQDRRGGLGREGDIAEAHPGVPEAPGG